MRHRALIKTSFLAAAAAAAAWSAAPAPRAQQHPEKPSIARPDKQVSDLTRDVAAKLPHAGGGPRRLAARNLIDQHLFGAMARDGVPRAALERLRVLPPPLPRPDRAHPDARAAGRLRRQPRRGQARGADRRTAREPGMG